MVDSSVGNDLIEWIEVNHPDDIGLLVCNEINENISAMSERLNVRCLVWKSNDESEDETCELINSNGIQIGFLLWWPKLIGLKLLSAPKFGFVNLHPSLLPFGRGKNPNFWAITESEPFGVSIHKVDEGIDHGSIIAQKHIELSWLDNGKTSYDKSILGIISLFKEIYPSLSDRVESGDFQIPRNERGSYHNSDEMDKKSLIDLEQITSVRYLLNLLRARTFEGRPSCSFIENGKRYLVTIDISEA
jgi:methionyl-tRNA formyltransferase